MSVRLDPRYGLLTAAYLAAVYRLSSLPDLGPGEGDSLGRVAFNLSHVPLFAGLAWCVLKSLPGARRGGWTGYALPFAVSALCAALDEWHQSFVPGRHASVGDFLLDLAGIGTMLLLLCLHARREQRREAAGITGSGPPARAGRRPRIPLPATRPLALPVRLAGGSNPKASPTGGRA